MGVERGGACCMTDAEDVLVEFVEELLVAVGSCLANDVCYCYNER